MGFQGDSHGLEGTTEDISSHFRHVKVKTDSSTSYEFLCSSNITHKSFLIKMTRKIK